MGVDVRTACGIGLAVAAAVVSFSSGCSHSKSTDQSGASSESTSNASDPSNSTGSSNFNTSPKGKGSTEGSGGGKYADSSELKELRSETKRFRAETEILKIKNTITSQYLMSDSNELPEDLSGLTEGENAPFERSDALVDPWGNRYIYRKKGDGNVEIFSAGPDGEPGTGDDVHSSESSSPHDDPAGSP